MYGRNEDGCCKDSFVACLASILGEEHVAFFSSMDHIPYQQAKLKSNLLTVVDYTTYNGNHRQSEQLKVLMTTKMRRCNEKHVYPFSVDNLSNYIMVSNAEFMTPNDNNRHCTSFNVRARFSGAQTPESKDYFDKLRGVDPHHWAAYLHTVDISDFFHPP